MSIEEKIDRLNHNIENLIGALVAVASAGGVGAAAAAADTKSPAADSAAPATTGKGKSTKSGARPGKTETANNSAAPAASAEADPFGDEDTGLGGGDDDGMGIDDTPVITIEDVKTKFYSLRDLAVAKFGKDEGLKKTRELLNKYTKKLEDMPADKFDDAIAECEKVTEKLNKMK